jgi:DeoR family transcriptional regulator of aga operon
MTMGSPEPGLVALSGKRTRRLASILELLEQRRTVKLTELTSSLGISAATARRDLADLADRRLLTRTHGGATVAEGHDEFPVTLRDTRFGHAKRAIARAALSQLPTELHVVALSGGTTTAYVARALTWRKDLTVVTNSLTVASIFSSQPRVRVLVTGGVLRSRSLELVGLLAEHAFGAVNIGTAILGADGVSASAGVTTHDETEARTNHAMVARAQRTIVVADGSKIGRAALSQMSPLTGIDTLVTDRTADETELGLIRSCGVQVVVADV